MIVLDFKLKCLFFEHIEHLYNYVGKFSKGDKVGGNFYQKFYIIFL